MQIEEEVSWKAKQKFFSQILVDQWNALNEELISVATIENLKKIVTNSIEDRALFVTTGA